MGAEGEMAKAHVDTSQDGREAFRRQTERED